MRDAKIIVVDDNEAVLRSLRTILSHEFKTMVNRNLYLKIIGSVSLIALFSLLGSVLLITGTSYFLSFVCLCVILLITLLLIQWINAINRKIAIFFESVRNGDTTLRYPDKTNDPFVMDLYTEMNRIILLFSQNQSEMEEKRLYYESILRVLTHEIRNSITPIRSLSADLLKYSDTYTPEQLREGLEVIHGQAQNLSASVSPTASCDCMVAI